MSDLEALARRVGIEADPYHEDHDGHPGATCLGCSIEAVAIAALQKAVAAEREACAKVADFIQNAEDEPNYKFVARVIAANIRARCGEEK